MWLNAGGGVFAQHDFQDQDVMLQGVALKKIDALKSVAGVADSFESAAVAGDFDGDGSMDLFLPADSTSGDRLGGAL